MEPSGDSGLKNSLTCDPKASKANDNSASGASFTRLRGGSPSHEGSTILRTSPFHVEVRHVAPVRSVSPPCRRRPVRTASPCGSVREGRRQDSPYHQERRSARRVPEGPRPVREAALRRFPYRV